MLVAKMGDKHAVVLLGGLLMLLGICNVVSAGRRKGNCVDWQKSLEDREEHANAVFSGTVKDLMPDPEHPKMYKGEVEIKRVFKGTNVIASLPGDGRGPFFSHKMVMVDGIGDPKICESFVRKYDTRIFLVNKGRDGELHLNSSLVRLTLNNLEHANAAVKDVPFEPQPRPTEAPCERKFCAFGAQCEVNATTGEAECKCMQKCSTIFAPVCGSDGVTYTSECQLRMASCGAQRRVRVRSQGTCDVKDPCKEKDCSFGAQCVPSLDGLTARCQCPERCDSYGDSVGSTPVCGSDGRDYGNQCEMRRSACREMKDLRVKYFGKCDPCEGHTCPLSQVCQLDEKRKPACRCNERCVLEFAPVCGTDGRTYSNECIMRVEACKRRKDIQVYFRGECSSGNNPCNNKSCGPGQECHVDRNGIARCTCPPQCEQVVRPVCGSDGLTYDNECELRRQACDNEKFVTVSFIGECTLDGPCSHYHCSYGATCVVRDKRPMCDCPPCSEDYKPVCGSDGISYSNECKLKVEGCEKRKHIQVQYQGLCNGCENKKCDHYAICESDGNGNARCVCPATCVIVDDKVCGTDGITYQNECELRVASCKKQQFIMTASHGPCDLCASVKCRFGARCENGKCVCPQTCPANIEPVCANDGQTYTNECEMRLQACSQALELEVVHSGECDDIASGSGDEGSAIEVCDETTCRYGGMCEYDAEGSHGCVCNFNCEAIRSPICGSDGKTYGNECQLREESCRKQIEITAQPMENCEDMDEELCDGTSPLLNPFTGRDYDCSSGRETCPAGSYCHRVGGMAKCCKEDQPIRTCGDTRFGCCPDGKTPAPGLNDAGCPSVCQCHPLGAHSTTCDPRTLQCTCKPGVGGRRCDRCEAGYWGLPRISEGNSGCIPCGCNVFGSVREDCEQMTGRCVCKPGVSGQKCNICSNGKDLGPRGCQENAPPARSCAQVACGFGAKCQLNNGIAECVCTSTCPSEEAEWLTVCGTNGQTYASQCQLKLFACRLQKDIRVAYNGPCQDTTTSSATTASPYGRPRKTTRHISSKVTRHIIPPTPSVPEYGIIGDLCINNDECIAKHSFCKNGLCVCKDSFTASEDKLFCLDDNAIPENIIDVCASSPCQNGGHCYPDKDSGYKCFCRLGKGGPRCAQGSSFMEPSFAGRSYLEFRKLHHANREVTITLEFRTLNYDGILLYAAQNETGSGDFVSLAVKDGHVEFRYDLGSGPVVLKSADAVVLNTYHKVVARRFGQDGSIKLDDGDEVTGSSGGNLKSLNLGTSLYMGYIPQATKEILAHMEVEVGLVGCIESFKVESKDFSKEYDLIYPGSRDIVGGFGISECGDNPCSSIPCQNGGTCMKVDADDFVCHCTPGWVGKMCEEDLYNKPCNPNPCVVGQCAVVAGAKFVCKCPTTRDGLKCEKDMVGHISIPEFDGNSFIELKLMNNVGRSLAYEIWFLATDPNGVILYGRQPDTATGDFISLNLVNGYLNFRYDLGSGIANITSTERIPMNVWHRVDVARSNRAGTMIVNAGNPIRSHSKGTLKELNLGDFIYLGGFPGEYNPNAGITGGLKGAIQRVYDDGQLISGMVSNAVSIYHLQQFPGKPCPSESGPCQNEGECLPMLNDYECKCAEGYTGHNCEKIQQNVNINNPLMFDGRTYHKYDNRIVRKDRSQKTNRFELTFRTREANGVLLLLHKSSTILGDYLVIAINQGHVEVSYNLGKQGAGDPHVISSPDVVDDGKWHHIVFHREKRKGTLVVDSGTPISDVSDSGATQLDTDGNLWIGGVHHFPVGIPDAYRRGFDGCIKSLVIDEERVQLVEHRTNHQPLEFCEE